MFEAFKLVEDRATAVAAAAVSAWGSKKGPERHRLVAETKWKLQLLGGTLERLRVLSARRKWFGWPPGKAEEILARSDMVELRAEITDDPFEDPDRNADNRRSAKIEGAVAAFTIGVEQRLFTWIR